MAADKKVSVVAVEPIQSGGKRHEPGATLSVSAAAAASLVEQGAATLAKPGKAGKPANDGKPEGGTDGEPDANDGKPEGGTDGEPDGSDDATDA